MLLPVPDASSRPYWEAAARGELLVSRCGSCQHTEHYPRPHCTVCGNRAHLLRSSGSGVLYTWTVVRQNRSRAFREDVPYVLCLVDLDDGARGFARLKVDPDRPLRAGMRVRAVFEEVVEERDGGNSMVLPMFELEGAQ